MTNGDYIRRMTDEELAKFLCNLQDSVEQDPCSECPAKMHCRTGHNGFQDWMKEGHNEY